MCSAERLIFLEFCSNLGLSLLLTQNCVITTWNFYVITRQNLYNLVSNFFYEIME